MYYFVLDDCDDDVNDLWSNTDELKTHMNCCVMCIKYWDFLKAKERYGYISGQDLVFGAKKYK